MITIARAEMNWPAMFFHSTDVVADEVSWRKDSYAEYGVVVSNGRILFHGGFVRTPTDSVLATLTNACSLSLPLSPCVSA